MISTSLTWIMQKVKGSFVNGVTTSDAANIIISGVSIDTRTLKTGDLFIALVGPNFDGHDYIHTAIEKGASAVIVSQDLSDKSISDHVAILKVDDTRLALGHIGSAVKQKVSPKTVGITGSSGKTTVKEMVKSILSKRGKVLATKGNFNNDIGVPLTLLELNNEHDYAVIEMGANHQGEIDYTCQLVQPDVATIVNASPAHIEGFGSLFGVARAKSEIIKGLKPEAVAILNHDSQFYDFWQGTSATQQILSFSYESQKGDFHARNVAINNEGCAEFELVTPIGKAAIKLRIPGVHNVGNAVLSAALAISVGANLVDVQQGLFDMQSVSGRLTVKMVAPRLKVIDDTYNANVGSVKAAIDLLASFSGFKVLVFGDMGELGDQAAMYHQQIGEYAANKNIDALISSGNLSTHASSAMGDKGMACSDPQTAFTALIKLIGPVLASYDSPIEQQPHAQINSSPVNGIPITVLVKGSRSAKMEQVVDAMMTFDFSQGEDEKSHQQQEQA